MSEVFSWNEGSALFWTGNSTTSALAAYATNIAHVRQITYTSYKPPHANTYTNYPYASGATLSMGQLYSQLDLINFFEAATGGGLHCHLKHLQPGVNISGGVFLYSGVFLDAALAGTEGAPIRYNYNFRFPTWSAY